MKELGITKGEWKSIYRNKHDRGIRSDKGYICFMTMPMHFPQQDARYDEELDECRADAELIADAGNTAQKCGLLPSELLQQRDELRKALKYIHRYWSREITPDDMEDALWEILDVAEAAIKNTER